MAMLEFTTHYEPFYTPCTQHGIVEHPVNQCTMAASATYTASLPPPGQGYQQNNNRDQRNGMQYNRR